MIKKLRIITSITFLVLISSLIMPTISFGSQGSSIAITRTPYLSFADLPDPFSFTSYTASAATGAIFSDPTVDLSVPGAGLPSSRKLIVSDTRNSGGFNLQVSATNFTGGTVTINKSNLRVLSSPHLSSPPAGAIANDVLYLSGFIGQQTLTTPVKAATDANLGTDSVFTTGTSAGHNALSGTVDILDGCLSSIQGRNGQMAIGMSFYLAIPKFTPPGTYDSTVTYTITDSTSGTC